ncbi:hypothetical protein CK203_091187 [Vitis vinifera]|uniref:Reverse transcriptase Ty1/copia-type domain-containing protein n=1 Tax=Vitis vinifera TaxID=29760 RepID=A0A438EMC5_VITVI|nr:hypothetical protein CK203_091187 [Vitis vinifera]
MLFFHESIFPFKHDQLFVSHLDFFFDRVLPDLFSDDIPILESLPSHPSNLVSYDISSNESLTIFPTTSDRPTRVLCYNRLFSSYRAFVHSIFLNIEPTCYTEAAMVLKWQHAMSLELQALESNDRPIERYKARLVTKGYIEQEGSDYLETFSPIAKVVTVKVLLVLAAIHG